jgi:hypothetical protein
MKKKTLVTPALVLECYEAAHIAKVYFHV